MGWVGKRVERRRFHVTRRPPPATDSGKLDWKCSSYPSLGSRFPSSLPPFALYPTFHSLLPLPSLLPPSPCATSHRRRRRAVRLLCAPTKGHHFTPMERPVLTHWPDINQRPITIPPISNNAGPLFLPLFSKQIFFLSRDRSG